MPTMPTDLKFKKMGSMCKLLFNVTILPTDIRLSLHTHNLFANIIDISLPPRNEMPTTMQYENRVSMRMLLFQMPILPTDMIMPSYI